MIPDSRYISGLKTWLRQNKRKLAWKENKKWYDTWEGICQKLKLYPKEETKYIQILAAKMWKYNNEGPLKKSWRNKWKESEKIVFPEILQQQQHCQKPPAPSDAGTCHGLMPAGS